jgi:hypothetical protein
MQADVSADAQDAVARHHAQSVCFVQAQQLVCSSQVSHTPSLHAPLVSGCIPEQADDDVPSLLWQRTSLDRIPDPHDVLQDPHGRAFHLAPLPPDNCPECSSLGVISFTSSPIFRPFTSVIPKMLKSVMRGSTFNPAETP